MAGAIREAQGSYLMAFVISGATGLIAAVIALRIGKKQVTPQPA
jgi:hypothetical protein